MENSEDCKVEPKELKIRTKEEIFEMTANFVSHALIETKFLSRTYPSRELSIVITKLEEAELWFSKCS